MADWDAIRKELSEMNTRLAQIATVVVGEQTREELMPIWDCGHRHAGRGLAIACKRRQQEALADGAG